MSDQEFVNFLGLVRESQLLIEVPPATKPVQDRFGRPIVTSSLCPVLIEQTRALLGGRAGRFLPNCE